MPGKENPADCASRSLTPEQLRHHDIWWTRPTWLIEPSTSWPTLNSEQDINEDLEERPSKVMTVIAKPNSYWDLLNTYSSLNKLLRITALS